MKTILLFLLILAVPAFGIIAELDSETFGQLDISSIKTILTDTPDASNPMLCQAYIVLGGDPNGLDGTGGAFEFVMTIGGQTVQPSPQIAIFGTEVRASIWTSQFLVPTGEAVIIQVTSPNAADTTVDVTAYLYDVFPVVTASGKVTLADGVTHGGSTAVLELKSVDVTNTDPGGVAVRIGGVNSGLRVTASGGIAVSISGETKGVDIFGEISGVKIGGAIGIDIDTEDEAIKLQTTNADKNTLDITAVGANSFAFSISGVAGDISADEIDDIIDKISAVMSKAYSLSNAVGTYDPAEDSLEAQQESPQTPPIMD